MHRALLLWSVRFALLSCCFGQLHSFGQFVSPWTQEGHDKFWNSVFDAALGPYGRPFEALQNLQDMHTAYGWSVTGGNSGTGKGVPKDGRGRLSHYAGPEHGAGGKSSRRHRWDLSSPWEYWKPGCLSTSTERFRKYFRMSRDRFDDIYSRAARSGKFKLNPAEPMFAELHAGGPWRLGRGQHDKVPPLCLKMAASFRRLATGESFASLASEFRVGLSTLHAFDKKFLKWFRMTYWKEYVVGESGVGFDDLQSIQQSEAVFRQFGLPGFITCMDGVHCAWELAPFTSRWQYKGKEGYPTVVINVHCTATGRIVYAGPIFPGAHNDKTMVHYDKLVQALCHDPLFRECKWSTCVPRDEGNFHQLHGCMTLCDSGYHQWKETMNGYKHPSCVADALWICRQAAQTNISIFIYIYVCICIYI